MKPLTVRLPLSLHERLDREARVRDVTPGQIVRHALALYLDAADSARTSEAQDEPLLAHIRSRVASALVHARTWGELERLLGRDRLGYAPKGGGLVVVTLDDGLVRAKASEVGPAYGALVRRFGQGFPGHTHPGAARRAMAGALIDASGQS